MSKPEYNLFDEAKVLADDRPGEEGNLLEWALDAEHMIRRLVKAFNSTPQPAQQDTSNESAYQRGYLDGMSKPCVECADRKLKALAEQPVQRNPLTDEEITAIYNKTCEDWTNRYDRPVVFARAIEAAHGIKENT